MSNLIEVATKVQESLAMRPDADTSTAPMMDALDARDEGAAPLEVPTEERDDAPPSFVDTLLEPRPDAIPDALKNLAFWVLAGAYQNPDGRISKPPFYRTNAGSVLPASINAAKCRKSFALALEDFKATRGETVNVRTSDTIEPETGELVPVYTVGKIAGLGFVLDPAQRLLGIDIDHCLPLPDDDWGRQVAGLIEDMTSLGFYVEKSISGTGVRAFARYQDDKIPGTSKPSIKGQQIELYAGGKRYLTVTGHALKEGHDPSLPLVSIDDDPAAMDVVQRLISLAVPPKQERAAENTTPAQRKPTRRKRGKFKLTPELVEAWRTNDDLLIERMRSGPKNGATFEALFYDGYPAGADESSEDMRLCNIVAHYVGNDPARVDRIMRRSALLADPDRLAKWDAVRSGDKRTYGQLTIDKAISSHRGAFYLDWLVAKKAGPNYAAQLERDADGMLEEGQERDTRETIRLEESNLVKTAAEIANGFTEGAIFQRAGFLCRLRKLEEPRHKRRGVKLDTGSIVTENLTPSAIALEASRIFRFERFSAKDDEWVPCGLKKEFAQAVLDLPRWPRVRVLSGVIRSPVIDLAGHVHTAPGYDPSTGFFHALDKQTASLPKMDEKEALATIFELLEDFPFADNEPTPSRLAGAVDLPFRPGLDFAVALSYLFSVVIRPFLPTCPLYAFNASTPGTGKTTLAKVGSLLGQGMSPLIISYKKDDADFGKELISAMLTMPSHLLVDNVPPAQRVNHSSLCTLLSDGELTARLLGSNATAKLDSTPLISITGNSLTLSEDMIRRSLLCTLNTNLENPEDRDFAHEDFVPWVLENRPRFLAALLTILRDFLATPKRTRAERIKAVTGKPLKALGSFLEWSDTVRACVIAMGLPDPVLSQRRIEAEDPARQRLEAFLAAWAGAPELKNIELTTSEICNATALGKALLDATGVKSIEALTTKRAGYWLREIKDRVLNGLKVVSCGQDSRSREKKWRLEEVR